MIPLYMGETGLGFSLGGSCHRFEWRSFIKIDFRSFLYTSKQGVDEKRYLRYAQDNIAKILLIIEDFRNRFLAPDILSSR